MSTIVAPSRRVTQVSYMLAYDFVDERGSGFSFDCDAHGRLMTQSAPALANYERCVANTHGRPVVFRGIERLESSHREPARLKCDCHRTLALSDPMTNKCDCGRFYNGSGQALSHPRNWGEETGERFDDEGHQIL
jgi:hypothetical protein